MIPNKAILLVTIGLTVSLGAGVYAQDEEPKDSADGLPAAYAKHYLVAGSTVSPDKKFALIYPTLDFSDSKEAKDFLVALNPFSVLGPLPTKNFYFQRQSNAGLTAEWTPDSSVALVTVESKWGPGDVFVIELAAGKMKRATNVLQKLTQLVLPKFRAAMPRKETYNNNYEFIYEPGEDAGAPCVLDGNKAVKIDLLATNDPKFISEHPWSVRVKAEWDIAQAKFRSQTITANKP